MLDESETKNFEMLKDKTSLQHRLKAMKMI